MIQKFMDGSDKYFLSYLRDWVGGVFLEPLALREGEMDLILVVTSGPPEEVLLLWPGSVLLVEPWLSVPFMLGLAIKINKSKKIIHAVK